MKIKIKRPGQLHRDLGVPQGEKIPRSKIAAARHSSNSSVRKRANFAYNAGNWNHG